MTDTANLRILIVDDNAQIHRDFSDILAAPKAPAASELESDLFDDPASKATSTNPTSLTFDLDCQFDGQLALKQCVETRLKGIPFAVAFVDMRMPGWDGLTTIEKLFEADPDIQIVLCTAYSDHSWEEIRRRVRQSDRFLILRKPFDSVEVQQLAASLCAKWELARLSKVRTNELESLVSDRTTELRRINEALTKEIEQRKVVESRILYAATHDPLTGLDNRASLTARIGKCLEGSHRAADIQTAVLYLDLDGFKEVNDHLGHGAGDTLLIEVARRLQQCIATVEPKMCAEVARLGGDEFAILVDNVGSKESLQSLAKSLISYVSEPFHVMGRDVTVGCSVGIATDRTHGTVDEILRDADLAMYEAKREGKRRFVWFEQRLADETFTKFDLEMDINRAIRQDEFTVAYQPIVSLNDGRIRGFEALVRWTHPKRGNISPGDFLPIAEQSGLIDEIGRIVLFKACNQLSAWSAQYPELKDAIISVNASPRQFFGTGFSEQVNVALRQANIPPGRLRIEIVESFLMEELQSVADNLSRLREAGVGLLLDDFGTGYSSLSSLHQLPISGIKLDRSFITRLDSSMDGAATVSAIIQIARHRELMVIAEGVETVAQLLQLQAMGCDYAQGFLLGRPQSAECVQRLFSQPSTWLEDLRKQIRAA